MLFDSARRAKPLLSTHWLMCDFLQAEAGLLLWHHCYRGEEGQAEIVGAGVAPSCLATLDSQDTSPSEKSTAAGQAVLVLVHVQHL